MGKRQRPGSLKGFANRKTCVPWVSPWAASIGSGERDGAAGRLRAERAPEPRAAQKGVRSLSVSFEEPRGC